MLVQILCEVLRLERLVFYSHYSADLFSSVDLCRDSKHESPHVTELLIQSKICTCSTGKSTQSPAKVACYFGVPLLCVADTVLLLSMGAN